MVKGQLTYEGEKFCYFNRSFNGFFQAGSRIIDIELTTLSSTNHVELNPSDAGFQDRYIVQEIIKEIAKNRPIETKGKKGFKGDSIFFFFHSWVYTNGYLKCISVFQHQSLLLKS